MGDQGPKRNACGSHGSIEDGRKRMESERWYGVLEKEGGEIDQGSKRNACDGRMEETETEHIRSYHMTHMGYRT